MYNIEYYEPSVVLAFMDRAAAAGVKLMYELDHSGWIKHHTGNLDRTDTILAAQLDALAANVSLVKDHPALLGYCACRLCFSSLKSFHLLRVCCG